MTVRYDTTGRGFSGCEVRQNGTPLVEVRCSSAVTRSGRSMDAIRSETGAPEPGASFLWITVRGPAAGPVAAHLDRQQVAELAGVLTRWLASGFVQGEWE